MSAIPVLKKQAWKSEYFLESSQIRGVGCMSRPCRQAPATRKGGNYFLWRGKGPYHKGKESPKRQDTDALFSAGRLEAGQLFGGSLLFSGEPGEAPLNGEDKGGRTGKREGGGRKTNLTMQPEEKSLEQAERGNRERISQAGCDACSGYLWQEASERKRNPIKEGEKETYAHDELKAGCGKCILKKRLQWTGRNYKYNPPLGQKRGGESFRKGE